MATGRQIDTTLVIRAKDEASRAVTAIERALQDLLGTQKDLASGSSDTATGLAKVLSTLAGMDRAYATIATAQDNAAAATTRQLIALARNQASLESLKKQLDAARQAQASYNAEAEKFVGPPTVETASRYKSIGEEIGNLQSQITKLNKTIDKQSSGFNRSASDLAELGKQTKLAGALTTFATQQVEEQTRALNEQAAAMRRVSVLQDAISRNTDSTTGKDARTSASVFRREGLTNTEQALNLTEQAASTERYVIATTRLEDVLGRVSNRSKEVAQATSQRAAIEAKAGREAAAAEEGYAAAAEKLRGALDPVALIQANLNKQLERLPAIAKAGKFSAEELAAAELLLKKNAEQAAAALGRTSTGKPTLFGLKPYDIQNLSFQINDIVTQLASGTSLTQTLAQQGGQLLQIFPQVGSSIVAAFRNPYVLAFVAALGVAIASLKELSSQERVLRGFDGALTAMGDSGGASAQALLDVTKALDTYSLSADEALKITQTFLREGLNPQRFEEFGRSAKDMADVLGIDVGDAAKQLADAFSGGYDAIVKLDKATNVYTASERQIIRTLFEEGKAHEARTKAFEIFEQRMDRGAQKARGPWTQAIDALSNAWDRLMQTIANSAAAKAVLEDIEHRLDSLTRFFDLLSGTGGSAPATGGNNTPIAQATDQLAALRKELGDASVEFARLTKGGSSSPSEPFTQRYVLALRTRIEALLQQIHDLENAKGGITATGPNSQETKDSNDTLHAMSQERELQKLREDGAQSVENLRVRNEGFLTEAEKRRRIALAGELAAVKAIGDQRVKDQARANAQDDERRQIQREQDSFNAANSTPAMVARQFIAARESFRSKAYWDVNHFRVGFGSDTTTSAGGAVSSVTKGTTVDLAGAVRDLDRRIKEFQDGIKALVGGDRFNAFTANQQAALTSVAYNYGTLGRTKDGRGANIADIVRTGTTQQIADAIKRLGSDNNGINRNRRNRNRRNLEAATFLTPNAAIEADNEKQAETAQQRQEKLNISIKEANDERARATAELETQNKLQDEALVQQQILAAGDKAVADLERRVTEQNANLKPYEQKLVLTQEQIDATKQLAIEEAKAQHARELAQAQTNSVERPVNDLTSERSSVRAQADALRAIGDTAGADALEQRLRGIDTRLISAIDHAIAFFKALDPGTDPLHRTQEQLDAIIAQLETAKVQTFEWDRILGISGETISNTFASSATNAIDGFAQSIANGENAFRSLGNAFRQFAADFLRQIAQMILQQAIFNAISGLFGGGGGGIVSSASNTIAANPAIFHDGGVAGVSKAPTRLVDARWFQNAVRYHEGGIAGLKPGEIPAILKRGEPVDPGDGSVFRKIFGGGEGGGAMPPIQIVNAIDAGDFVSKGMATKSGQMSILNFIRDNPGAVKEAMNQ